MRKARLFLFSATLLVTASGIAGADTIYATVGPNGSVLLPTAYAIGGSLGLQQGDFFVPQMNARVGSLQGVFGWTYGLNSLEVQLLSDIGGRPGAVLDTFLFRNLPPHSDSVTLRPLQSANSTFMPELMAGATYWLIAIAAPGSLLDWYPSTYELANGRHFIRQTLGVPGEDFEGGPKSAFRLNTEHVNDPPPVPEPGTLSLLAIGALVARRACQRIR